MEVIKARNVHEAYVAGMSYLNRNGARRDSRNGPVIQSPGPVSTVYARPFERVIFWPRRNANPFFHLFESLWMLQGRKDLALPQSFVSRFQEFSDNGETLNGAYGHRWRAYFGRDQILIIARRLGDDKTDRRCVLQMWDSTKDLDSPSRDVPCNLVVTFQVGSNNKLDMVVFCRSNDIIWGAYGANAVHFSILQEYVASLADLNMGTYTQISVNYHAYLDVFKRSFEEGQDARFFSPYKNGATVAVPLFGLAEDVDEWDDMARRMLNALDAGQHARNGYAFPDIECKTVWWKVVRAMSASKIALTYNNAPKRYERALYELDSGEREVENWSKLDWIVASKQWIRRARDRWVAKNNQLATQTQSSARI